MLQICYLKQPPVDIKNQISDITLYINDELNKKLPSKVVLGSLFAIVIGLIICTIFYLIKGDQTMMLRFLCSQVTLWSIIALVIPLYIIHKSSNKVRKLSDKSKKYMSNRSNTRSNSVSPNSS